MNEVWKTGTICIGCVIKKSSHSECTLIGVGVACHEHKHCMYVIYMLHLCPEVWFLYLKNAFVEQNAVFVFVNSQ